MPPPLINPAASAGLHCRQPRTRCMLPVLALGPRAVAPALGLQGMHQRSARGIRALAA